MQYTFKRIAGILCIALAIIIVTRFIPMGVWYFIVMGLGAGIGYFLYQCWFK